MLMHKANTKARTQKPKITKKYSNFFKMCNFMVHSMPRKSHGVLSQIENTTTIADF